MVATPSDLFAHSAFATDRFLMAHTDRLPSSEQSTQSTSLVARTGPMCWMNQQYLFLITMTLAYHWPRQIEYGECALFASF
jgi:hypothetical protein